jgi:rhamnosyltransferase
MIEDPKELNRVRPTVLILMAYYNGGEWIAQQLDSICAQEGCEISILISDDGSDQESSEIIKNLAKNRPEARVVFHEKSSGSASTNFFWLISNCKAEEWDYIAFADQDDIWHPKKLLAATSMLQREKADGYSCSVTAFWEDGASVVLTQCSQRRLADYLFEGAGQGCSFVLTKSFFLEIRAYVLQKRHEIARFHYHDWLVYLLSRKLNKEWVFDETPYVEYRQHSSNDTGAKGSIAAIASRVRLIRGGWYKEQISTAIDISRSFGVSEAEVEDFKDLFAKTDSIERRLRLAFFCSLHGRRKRADRGVLSISSLFGWI